MNPIITNVALVSRFDKMALAARVVIDGASIATDRVLPRGTLLVKSGLKWHPFAHGVDTLAVDAVRILTDEVRMTAGVDTFVAAYFEGFFNLDSLKDANHALVEADLTIEAGFHFIESNEVRLK